MQDLQDYLFRDEALNIVAAKAVDLPSSKILLILIILLILSISPASSCFAQAPKKEAPPAVEKITESVYRVGKATVDLGARTVTCSGRINMDAGAIEYLAVAPGGKTHESLLLVEVRPLHLQVGLLLLGLEPKNVLKTQGDKNTPVGAPVELWIRWKDGQGKVQEARAEELVSELPFGKAMPSHSWVFTGSRILAQGFEADLQKSLVAVWHDPAAILDNPLPGGANNAYIVNSKRAPKRGTVVEFVIKAPTPPKNETKN